mmetsp:Transcript_79669/g.234367  ORF Transcript_79669/g.234367 Transcript_79669/m.234367 type:complete len:249 (-) Transcript_79669:942-1688(-)
MADVGTKLAATAWRAAPCRQPDQQHTDFRSYSSKSSSLSRTPSNASCGCDPASVSAFPVKLGFVVRKVKTGMAPQAPDTLASMLAHSGRSRVNLIMSTSKSLSNRRDFNTSNASTRSSPASAAASVKTDQSASFMPWPKCRQPRAAMNSSFRPLDCAQSTSRRLSMAEDVLPVQLNFTSYRAPACLRSSWPKARTLCQPNQSRSPVSTLCSAASSGRRGCGRRQTLNISLDPAASRVCIAAYSSCFDR